MTGSPPDLALPEETPVLPLRELVVFPYMTLPLFVARGPSVAAIDDAMAADRVIVLVAQRDPETQDPEPDDLPPQVVDWDAVAEQRHALLPY